MSDTTIPDATTADLREYFLAAPPAGVTLSTDRLRFKHAAGDPPSPRLVFLVGDPIPQAKMDGTAKIPISIEYITSMDSVTPAAHQAVAGKIDEWWRSIRGAKRRNVIVTRVYLHDLVTKQPTSSINKEDREQVTAIRGDLMVTLVAI